MPGRPAAGRRRPIGTHAPEPAARSAAPVGWSETTSASEPVARSTRGTNRNTDCDVPSAMVKLPASRTGSTTAPSTIRIGRARPRPSAAAIVSVQRPGVSGSWCGPCMTLKRSSRSSPSDHARVGGIDGPCPPPRWSRNRRPSSGPSDPRRARMTTCTRSHVRETISRAASARGALGAPAVKVDSTSRMIRGWARGVGFDVGYRGAHPRHPPGRRRWQPVRRGVAQAVPPPGGRAGPGAEPAHGRGRRRGPDRGGRPPRLDVRDGRARRGRRADGPDDRGGRRCHAEREHLERPAQPGGGPDRHRRRPRRRPPAACRSR